jgi:hypothetical protein
MALSAGRAACACNATVVMIDLDNECPGPDVARALGRTPARRRRARPHTPSPGPSPSWPSRTKTDVGSAGGQRRCLCRRTPIPADRAGSPSARAADCAPLSAMRRPTRRLLGCASRGRSSSSSTRTWTSRSNSGGRKRMRSSELYRRSRRTPNSGLEVLLQAAWRLADAAP